MWNNYLSVLLRGIWKYKAFSAINITGLVIGISCSVLILLYVQYEFSYDRYHEYEDRIVRISLHGVLAGNEINAVTSPYPMAAALRREFAEVENATRLRRFYQGSLVSIGDINYQEDEVFHADPNFFDIFSYRFVSGNSQTALVDPNTLVISQSMAAKYFPGTAALGQSLTINNDRDYLITGVIEDIPANSHFHPDFLVSFASDSEHDSDVWISNNIQTYVLLNANSSIEQFEENLATLIPKYIAPQIEAVIGLSLEEFLQTGGRYAYGVQALSTIHLNSRMEGEIEANGQAAYVYTFQAIAFFVLLLACINFMNLSTARSANRAREIGIRKVVGAKRGQIIQQFLAESVLTCVIALLLAIPLLWLIMPAFNAITGKEMSLAILFSLPALLLLLIFTLLVGLVSGSYPALFLSSFNPLQVLKGKYSHGAKSIWFRGSLVVFQFAISIALVTATLIVYNQLDFMRNKPLGFEQQQVLVIHRAGALADQMESFKEVVARLPAVAGVSSSVQVPGVGMDQNVYLVDGKAASNTYALWTMSVNYDFIETLGMEMLNGRSFSKEYGTDSRAYIINETAARQMQLERPTEHRLLEAGPDGELDEGAIIGVVKDFHFESLHQEIRPMVLRLRDFARFIVVRIDAANIPQTIAALEYNWRNFTDNQPFEYSFLDEDFENLYQGDRSMGELFSGFSALAIFIAVLGLYGLASFTTSQRTKEIGIRRTLGASVTQITVLIAKEFLLLVVIALLLAIPIAWLAMNQWLQLFSYRITISPTPFALAGLLALVIAFVTVSLLSVKAALTNPVLSLRDE